MSTPRPILWTFPPEPTADGTRVVAHTDGYLDGAAWRRIAVQSAIPPKATRRWCLVEPPYEWRAAGFDVEAVNGRYRSWLDLLSQVGVGARLRASIEVFEPDTALSDLRERASGLLAEWVANVPTLSEPMRLRLAILARRLDRPATDLGKDPDPR